jgi:hypothetical protein
VLDRIKRERLDANVSIKPTQIGYDSDNPLAKGEVGKVGVAIVDITAGLFACSAILAALHYREKTGEGQHIDMALLGAQVAWLANQASNYLVSGRVPRRMGNAHPNIVPYETFKAKDGIYLAWESETTISGRSSARSLGFFSGWSDGRRSSWSGSSMLCSPLSLDYGECWSST